MAMTPEQVKKRLERAGTTQVEWAAKNGYSYDQVNRVLNGQCKARRGKGHDIAVKLGLKDAATA